MKSKHYQQLKLKQNLFKLALISFVVVIVWIGFEIYWSYTRPETTKQIRTKVEPISSNLYLEYVQILAQRTRISQSELEVYRQQADQTARQLQQLQATTPPPALSASLSASPAPEASPSSQVQSN